MLLEFDNGLSLAALSQTVEEYLTSWLSASKLSWRESTYGSYAANVKSMIIPHIGKIRLKDFRPEHIQRLYELLTKSDVKVHGIRKVHTILHGAIAQALRMGVVRSNPVSSIKQPRKPDKEMSIWDQFQAKQFLVTTSDHRTHALFHLALTTGSARWSCWG